MVENRSLRTQLPTGTVTFLFTDIEGSTPLWEREAEKMAAALQIHNAALRQAIEANGGVVFKTVGDAFQAAFATAPQALKAAIEGQRALQSAPWNELGPLAVRMGLHTGEAELDPGGDEYAVSHTKNRIGRIHSAAHGGQILLSQETAELVNHQLPSGISLKDLGEHRLKGMQWLEHLYQANAPGLSQAFPALATAISHPNNLPLQMTSFIGRKKEMAEVCRLLKDHRLVTLTGSGGTGKTRLSLEIASQMLEEFEHGVWLAELAPLAEEEKVTRVVAAALGMQEASDLPILEVLSDYVKNRHLLLVLDNCEHLLEACSRLVDHLLRTSPGLTVLASSREALGIGGEAAYHVPSLTLPDLRQLSLPDAIAQSEAVSLFAERAALALAGFQVTPQNAPAVVKICRRLDGIPLAIELAAARAAALSIEQIAARLNDRFRLLTGGSRTALPRQQTLRASIDWSYSQLPEVERRLLNSLSVFAGGWSLEAAEQVCAGDGIEAEEMLDLLTSLVKKSLATFTAESGQEPRYHLLETIRQYAREKLLDYGGGEDLRRRHLIYFLALAEQAEAEFQGLLQREWMERLDTELENLRTALEWGLVDESPEAFLEGLRLILALCMVELTISADESSEWLEKYQAHPCGAEATPVELHAKTWSAFGILRFWQGNYPASRQAFSVSLALYRQLGDIQSQVYVLGYMSVAINFLADPAAQLGCVNEAISIAQQAGIYLQNLASLLRAKGFYYLHADLEIARRSYVECVALFEKRGDRLSAIAPLRFLGAIASAQGEAERAEGYLQKAVAASREMKSLRNLFYDLSASGDHAHRVGHYEQMEAFFREAQEVSEKIGLRNGTVWCLHHLGVAVRRQGQLQRAIHLTSKSLEYAREYDFAELVAECIASLAGLALDFGRLQESSRWMAAVEAQQGKLFVGPICELELQRDTAQVRALLGEEAFQAALLEGRALTLDQAVEEALAFCREADTG